MVIYQEWSVLFYLSLDSQAFNFKTYVFNNSAYRLQIAWHLQGECVVLIRMKCVYINRVKPRVDKTRAPDRRRDD